MFHMTYLREDDKMWKNDTLLPVWESPEDYQYIYVLSLRRFLSGMP
jgi:hypothetical protein